MFKLPVWFCLVLQICCALEVAPLTYLCPARTSLEQTLDHGCRMARGPTLSWSQQRLAAPSPLQSFISGCFCNQPQAAHSHSFAKIPHFPCCGMASTPSVTNCQKTKGWVKLTSPWHLLPFFSFFFFPFSCFFFSSLFFNEAWGECYSQEAHELQNKLER